jgi:hypothetical protein
MSGRPAQNISSGGHFPEAPKQKNEEGKVEEGQMRAGVGPRLYRRKLVCYEYRDIMSRPRWKGNDKRNVMHVYLGVTVLRMRCCFRNEDPRERNRKSE